MSFKHRKIDIVLEIGQGADGLDAGETTTLSGHRVSVSCSVAGGVGMSQTSIRIFGLTQSIMRKFSTLGTLPLAFRRNLVTVLASDESGNMAQIFQGTILTAYADMIAAPEVAFNITALGGLIEAVMHAPPSTFPGPVDAAVVLQGLAAQAGLDFENHGVSVMLSKPYYPGAIRAQILECIEDAGISGIIDNGKLEIWPHKGVRGGGIPLISPDTGMVGYPTYSATGLVVTSVFNPQVQCGAPVEVQSSQKEACGTWNVVTLVHDIEAETPGGKWFTQLQLAAQGLVVVPTK